MKTPTVHQTASQPREVRAVARRQSMNERKVLRRQDRKKRGAEYESKPDQYIKVPRCFTCRTCNGLHLDCYLARTLDSPKGTAGVRCACCIRETCSFVTTESVLQEAFQRWLDSQPLPDTLDTVTPSCLTVQPAVPTFSDDPSGRQRDRSINSFTELSLPLDKAIAPVASTSGTLTELLDRPTTPPLPLTCEPFLAHKSPERDRSQSTDAKRPRDAVSTEDTSKPDKAAKTAHIRGNTSLPPVSYSPDEPSSNHHRRESDDWPDYEGENPREHDTVMSTNIEATKDIGRLEQIIMDMTVENKRLMKDFLGYRMMSGSLVTKAAEEELQAERRSTDHKMELARIKNQLDITQAQLKQFVDKAEEIGQVEKGRTRYSDSLGEDALTCQLQDMESQYTAAVKNADTSRKARNEAQTNLATTQAENARLHEQIATMTANHDYETIELSELRAENKRLRAEVVDLAKVKADLQTTQTSLDQHLADKTRLDIELEDGKDEIDRLKSKLRVHTDVDPDLHREGL